MIGRRRTRAVEGAIAFALGSSFVALGVLVSTGVFTRIDQWAVDHVMPGQNGADANPSLLASLFPIFDPGEERGRIAVAAVTYAVVWIASVAPAVLAVGGLLAWMRSRGHALLAWPLAAAFVAANLVEVVVKAGVTRPALYAHLGFGPLHVVPFDTSFPSGHELRAAFITVCVIACVRTLWIRWLSIAWLAATTVLLVVGGWHTPTDVAGGLVLALAVCLAAFASASAAAGCVARHEQPTDSQRAGAGHQ
jgi:membrane-associated phospholipid phosphatase